jgi:hypothetical protein
MKIRLLGLAALGLLTAWLLAAMPARAQDVDQRIQALEQELSRLKSEQAQVKAEQIEMRKQATEAAAALPNFTYRPGGGMLIEAADKSWSFRASIEAHFRLLFESGLSQAGRETGGIMGRRFRPWFYYCVNDCFYEIQAALDLDGFGTGNAKNSVNSATSSILQRGTLWVHFEKLNPWLPAFYTGMDGEAAISSYRQGSSSTGAQLEYDLLSRNNGFNTGRWGNGIGFNWQDIDLSGIGIPGRMPLANVVYATIGEGDDGLQSFRTPRSVSAYINIEPLAQLKNKWLQGIGLEFGQWWCPSSANINTLSNIVMNGCSRINIQDNGDGGRQVLVQTPTYGSGSTHFFMPGFAYTVGPYRFRAVGGFQRDNTNSLRGPGGTAFITGSRGHSSGTVFLFGHDLYVWSPKGFLTGSAETPGSILFGQHFERDNVFCGGNGQSATQPFSCVGAQFNRNRVLLREWDLWYVLMSRMSVGAAWMWYDSSNLRTGVNQAGPNLGVFSQRCTTCAGRGGEWLDFSVTWRYQF